MADQNVPPRRPRDDRGRTGPTQPDPDATTPYAATSLLPAYGARWVGPDVFPHQDRLPFPGGGLPTLDDDEEPGRRLGRRRTLVALGGAVVAGGAALAMSPRVRGLFGDEQAAGDATGTAVTDGTAARPGGRQPSTVRTYPEQNESYMGSRAGAAMRKNSPAGGRVFAGPAAAAAATRVTVRTVLAKDPIRHLAGRATFGVTPKVRTSAGTMVNGWNEAGELLAGGRTWFTYPRPERLVADPPATAGAYLDALAKRLVHQQLSARERALVLAVAGVPATAKVDATFNGAIVAVARTILASPQHHLR